MINLTVSVMAYRNKRLYGHRVNPDEALSDTADAVVLPHAVEWLRAQRCN
jgi:hypothetical protein